MKNKKLRSKKEASDCQDLTALPWMGTSYMPVFDTYPASQVHKDRLGLGVFPSANKPISQGPKYPQS